ncbi:hypothetical protein ACP275_07G113200 [Erythranthe tilingii]
MFFISIDLFINEFSSLQIFNVSLLSWHQVYRLSEAFYLLHSKKVQIEELEKYGVKTAILETIWAKSEEIKNLKKYSPERPQFWKKYGCFCCQCC